MISRVIFSWLLFLQLKVYKISVINSVELFWLLEEVLSSNERNSISRSMNLILFNLILDKDADLIVIFLCFILFSVALYCFLDLDNRKSRVMTVSKTEDLAFLCQSFFALFFPFSIHIIIKRLDLPNRNYRQFRNRDKKLRERGLQVFNWGSGHHNWVVDFLTTVLRYIRLCILFLFENSGKDGSDNVPPFLNKFANLARIYFWV